MIKKTLLRWSRFLIFAGLFIVCPAILAFLLIDGTPVVTQHQKLSLDNVQQVADIVTRNKPGQMYKKQLKTVILSENDLNILLGYGMVHGFGSERVFTKVMLPEGRIHLFATVLLPYLPKDMYVNAMVSLKKGGALLDIDDLKIGSLTFPGRFINPAMGMLHEVLLGMDKYSRLYQHVHDIKDISIAQGRLKIVYEWDPATLKLMNNAGKELILSKEHQEKMLFYHNKLMQTLLPHKNKKISLAQVLRPMGQFLEAQSNISSDPVLENTALLQVLAVYSAGKDLGRFVNDDIQQKMVPFVQVSLTLLERTDLTKHLLISAGIAVSAGSKLSNLIGVAKEVDDSERGTGFSFADLAADQAGVRMGEMATLPSHQARWFQKKMSAIEREEDFMPAIDGLPEGIRKLEFRIRYKDLDSESYAMVNDEIGKRITECTLYKVP